MKIKYRCVNCGRIRKKEVTKTEMQEAGKNGLYESDICKCGQHLLIEYKMDSGYLILSMSRTFKFD